jgi:signal transduction protein with GAF and PtsI domain
MHGDTTALWSQLVFVSANEPDYEQFLHQALRLITQACKAKASSIFEVESSGEALFFRTGLGPAAEKVGDFLIPVGSGIVGSVAQSRENFFSNAVADDTQHLKAISSILNYSFKSVMAAPLLVQGEDLQQRVIGVIELFESEQGSFSEEDQKLFDLFSKSLSQCVQLRMYLNWLCQKVPVDQLSQSLISA